MKHLRLRALLSSILLLTLLISLITGLALHLTMSGLVLGQPRYYITTVHFWTSLLLAVTAIIHFSLNLRLYFRELKALREQERRHD